MVCEQPHEPENNEPAEDDQQTLVIHEYAQDVDLAFHKGLEHVKGTDEALEPCDALHPEPFQNNEAHGEGRNDLRGGQASQSNEYEPVAVNYGSDIEEALESLGELLRQEERPTVGNNNRWLGIKLLENDRDIIEKIKDEKILSAAEESAGRLENLLGESPEIIMAERRYGFISGACQEAVRTTVEARHNMSDKIDEIINVNIKCMTHMTKLALPAMLEKNDGSIVNLSSTAAFIGAPNAVCYSATKAYIRIFTETLAMELHNTGVKVLCVFPGATTTHFWEYAQMTGGKYETLVRKMTAEDVARATIAELVPVQGMGKERAERLIKDAANYISRKNTDLETEETIKDNDEPSSDDITNG